MCCQKGREVFVFTNGHLKKFHMCKVKPFKCAVNSFNEVDGNEKVVVIRDDLKEVHHDDSGPNQGLGLVANS